MRGCVPAPGGGPLPRPVLDRCHVTPLRLPQNGIQTVAPPNMRTCGAELREQPGVCRPRLLQHVGEYREAYRVQVAAGQVPLLVAGPGELHDGAAVPGKPGRFPASAASGTIGPGGHHVETCAAGRGAALAGGARAGSPRSPTAPLELLGAPTRAM